MPWTEKQQKVAQAVEHGWKPKGSAKGFTEKFAAEVIAESETAEKPKRKHISKAEQHMGKGAKAAPKW